MKSVGGRLQHLGPDALINLATNCYRPQVDSLQRDGGTLTLQIAAAIIQQNVNAVLEREQRLTSAPIPDWQRAQTFNLLADLERIEQMMPKEQSKPEVKSLQDERAELEAAIHSVPELKALYTAAWTASILIIDLRHSISLPTQLPPQLREHIQTELVQVARAAGIATESDTPEEATQKLDNAIMDALQDIWNPFRPQYVGQIVAMDQVTRATFSYDDYIPHQNLTLLGTYQQVEADVMNLVRDTATVGDEFHEIYEGLRDTRDEDVVATAHSILLDFGEKPIPESREELLESMQRVEAALIQRLAAVIPAPQVDTSSPTFFRDIAQAAEATLGPIVALEPQTQRLLQQEDAIRYIIELSQRETEVGQLPQTPATDALLWMATDAESQTNGVHSRDIDTLAQILSGMGRDVDHVRPDDVPDLLRETAVDATDVRAVKQVLQVVERIALAVTPQDVQSALQAHVDNTALLGDRYRQVVQPLLVAINTVSLAVGHDTVRYFNVEDARERLMELAMQYKIAVDESLSAQEIVAAILEKTLADIPLTTLQGGQHTFADNPGQYFYDLGEIVKLSGRSLETLNAVDTLGALGNEFNVAPSSDSMPYAAQLIRNLRAIRATPDDTIK